MRKSIALTLAAFYLCLGFGPLFGLHAHDLDHGREVHAHGGLVAFTAGFSHTADHADVPAGDGFANQSHGGHRPELPLDGVLDQAKPQQIGFSLRSHEREVSRDHWSAVALVSRPVQKGDEPGLRPASQARIIPHARRLIRGLLSPRSPPYFL